MVSRCEEVAVVIEHGCTWTCPDCLAVVPEDGVEAHLRSHPNYYSAVLPTMETSHAAFEKYVTKVFNGAVSFKGGSAIGGPWSYYSERVQQMWECWLAARTDLLIN